jgi:hypothetical protein
MGEKKGKPTLDHGHIQSESCRESVMSEPGQPVRIQPQENAVSTKTARSLRPVCSFAAKNALEIPGERG